MSDRPHEEPAVEPPAVNKVNDPQEVLEIEESDTEYGEDQKDATYAPAPEPKKSRPKRKSKTL